MPATTLTSSSDFTPVNFTLAAPTTPVKPDATPALPSDAVISAGPAGLAGSPGVVSSEALANALGDGSFGTHIINAAPAPAPVAAPHLAIAHAPTPPPAASDKTVRIDSPARGRVQIREKIALSDPPLDDQPATTPSAPAIVEVAATAPTPPKLPDAPVKTMTAPDASPAAPAEHAQEAVRVAESLGHKRVLASGEARGHIVVPELGRVEVRAQAHGISGVSGVASAVHVNVQVDDAQARAVVQQHAPELRAHVQADVPNAHVQLDQRGNHGQSERRQPSRDEQERGSNGGNESAQGTDETVVQRQNSGRRGAARYVL